MRSAWTIIVLILIAAIGGVWWYRSQLEQPLQLPETPTDSALQLIVRLNKIDIDTAWFEKPEFLRLQSQPMPSEEGIVKGKNNPFRQ